MVRQAGFFDVEERLRELSANPDEFSGLVVSDSYCDSGLGYLVG
jgi:hypothetical protein